MPHELVHIKPLCVLDTVDAGEESFATARLCGIQVMAPLPSATARFSHASRETPIAGSGSGSCLCQRGDNHVQRSALPLAREPRWRSRGSPAYRGIKTLTATGISTTLFTASGIHAGNVRVGNAYLGVFNGANVSNVIIGKGSTPPSHTPHHCSQGTVRPADTPPSQVQQLLLACRD